MRPIFVEVEIFIRIGSKEALRYQLVSPIALEDIILTQETSLLLPGWFLLNYMYNVTRDSQTSVFWQCTVSNRSIRS